MVGSTLEAGWEGSEEGEGRLEGMDWATVRKNSSMYWRETGSYWEGFGVRGGGFGGGVRGFVRGEGGMGLTSTG